MYRSKIVATGLGIPAKRTTNDDLAKIVDTNDEWIRTRTGIHERRFLNDDESLSQICAEAGEQALKNAGLGPKDIDHVITATISAETFMPSNSARVIGHLGLSRASGFDMSAACAGFITALHTADAFIRSGAHKRIMVFGAEHISSALNFKDRSTCVLFGDGAGCAILERTENSDPKKDSMIIGSKIYLDFDKYDSLIIPGGGSRSPAWNTEKLKANPPYIVMNGQEVFKLAVKGMVRAATEVLEEAKVSTSEIKWFVPHQANIRIIEMTAKYLDFPMERVFVNIDKWANTSAGTVAIALAEMDQQGLLKKGDVILTDVFGGGFNYGAALIRW